MASWWFNWYSHLVAQKRLLIERIDQTTPISSQSKQSQVKHRQAKPTQAKPTYNLSETHSQSAAHSDTKRKNCKLISDLFAIAYPPQFKPNIDLNTRRGHKTVREYFFPKLTTWSKKWWRWKFYPFRVNFKGSLVWWAHQK